MSLNNLEEYWVPEHVKDYLRKLGFVLPLDDMEPWIRSWDDWMGARGNFYDYRDTDGMGRVYEVHMRSIHRPCASAKSGCLLLNEDVKVISEDQKVTVWLDSFFSSTNFMSVAQAAVARAFGLGTGAWAMWLDLDHKKVRIRHYDAHMVIPLTWDEDGVTECASSPAHSTVARPWTSCRCTSGAAASSSLAHRRGRKHGSPRPGYRDL